MAEGLYCMQVIQWALYCTAHGAVMQQPILKCLGVMEAAKTSASTHVLGAHVQYEHLEDQKIAQQ